MAATGNDAMASEAADSSGSQDPAIAVGLLLTGSLLSFYVVGLPLIALGAWMWARRQGREVS
jgi:hypothetical protein